MKQAPMDIGLSLDASGRFDDRPACANVAVKLWILSLIVPRKTGPFVAGNFS